MLDSLKRWIIGDAPRGPAAALVDWGHEHGWRLARIDDGAAWFAEGTVACGVVRLEWGRPHGLDLGAPELRVRCPVDTSHHLQLMAMTRGMADRLEVAVHRWINANQPGVAEANAPEELHWLTILPKVNLARVAEPARSQLVVLCNQPGGGIGWITPEVSEALAAGPWGDTNDLMLMVRRGQLHVRVPCEVVQHEALDRLLALTHSVVGALGAVKGLREEGLWQTTASTAWQGRLTSGYRDTHLG